MRASDSFHDQQLDELKTAVKTAEQSLRQSHQAIAELDARLAWSHSRQVPELSEARENRESPSKQ